jgi:hypothetical protein
MVHAGSRWLRQPWPQPLVLPMHPGYCWYNHTPSQGCCLKHSTVLQGWRLRCAALQPHAHAAHRNMVGGCKGCTLT